MKHLITFLLLLSPFCVLSQTNYHKGSITNNSGQTLSGYINLREWDESPKYIEFKNSPDDREAQKFYPSGIRSFAVDGFDKYYSYLGRVSLNPTRFPYLQVGKDTTSKIDNVFLKLITTGDHLTLYAYTDSLKTRFYIQEKQELPYELLYQQYYDESKTRAHTESRYAGQLSSLIIKYSNTDLLSKTESLKYDLNDIQDVVNAINGNKVVRRSRSNTRLYIGAALSLSNTSFKVANELTTYNKSAVYSPKLNVGIDIFNNPDIQALVFRFELSVGYVSPQFSSNTSDYIKTYSYNQYMVGITPQIICNIYNKDAVKVYIDGGMAFNFSSYQNNILTEKSLVYASQVSVAPALNKVWFYFPVQAGIVFDKKIELFFSASVGGASYTNDTNYSLKGQVYSAGVHYLFK